MTGLTSVEDEAKAALEADEYGSGCSTNAFINFGELAGKYEEEITEADPAVFED